jgi:hypothetical protein
MVWCATYECPFPACVHSPGASPLEAVVRRPVRSLVTGVLRATLRWQHFSDAKAGTFSDTGAARNDTLGQTCEVTGRAVASAARPGCKTWLHDPAIRPEGSFRNRSGLSGCGVLVAVSSKGDSGGDPDTDDCDAARGPGSDP